MIFQQASNIGAVKILFTQFYGNREKITQRFTWFDNMPTSTPQERETNGFTI